MKIKCPVCNEDGCYYTKDELETHLVDHVGLNTVTTNLLFKIHEKIKENDIADPEQMRVVDVLESLLEDEK